MKIKLYWLLANLVFLIHVLIVFIILFGWHYPQYRAIYLSTLALTLISEASLGYCILTKWEFDLRKKIEPDLNYDYSFIAYYGHKLFKLNIPKDYIKYSAIAFLSVSIVWNLWK